MDSDLTTINAEVFDEELYTENTPQGYAVFSSDRDGEMVSPLYDDHNTALSWKAGWDAAMGRIEDSV